MVRSSINMIKEYLGGSADLFSAIGALATGAVAFSLALKLFRFFIAHFLSRALGLSANLKEAGAWAVVTGCTDGIGKAYAEQLAARGLNVVLVSRTLSKLEDMAREVEGKYNVQTRVVAADFSREDIYDEIKAKLASLDIGVLVNNVGCSYDHPEFFAEVDTPDFVRNMIHMNCTSVAKMTELVLPAMAQKRRGYVINIGSSAGTNPTPLLTLYSATKAFVDMFSRALHHEYSGRGVTVQCVRPFFVVSKLSKFRNPTLFVPSPTTFVKNALNTIGVQSVTTGFWAHEIQEYYMQYVPTSFAKNFMLQGRNKALKKKASSSKNQ